MAKVISSLSHPVRVPYGKELIIIPPYGVIEVKEPSKLGALPKGVLVLKEKESKKKSK